MQKAERVYILLQLASFDYSVVNPVNSGTILYDLPLCCQAISIFLFSFSVWSVITSINYFLFSKVIAATVLSDPVKYNEAFLGKPNEEYCDWILNPEKWGGERA